MTLINDPTSLCLKYIYETNQSVFLTGKAGTGKTTLLKRIIKESPKNTVVVAPTGIAALNAGGVTIHSIFHLPFGTFLPDFGQASSMGNNIKLENRISLNKHLNYNRVKKNLLQELELLIIDEVSMLRADVLDAIDWSLRRTRNNNEAFGGVQVLFIGDLLQLPPVVKREEWPYLKPYYSDIYFFNALVLKDNQPIYIELDKIYRQSDKTFIDILNELRNNRLTQQNLDILNSHFQEQPKLAGNENLITLTTHNQKADKMNAFELEKLESSPITYKAIVKGNFPEHIFPNELNLRLKAGAQVMFLKNDTSFEKRYYNGKIGIIQSLNEDEIQVFLPEDNKIISVEQYEWENVNYQLDTSTNEIREKVVGTFVQYPLKLAWAITIHKSQGLTFDKAILDVSDVFASGQAYVALSRLRSLDGLILKSRFQLEGIESDKTIVQFGANQPSINLLNDHLSRARIKYLELKLITAFQWINLEEAWRRHLSTYKNISDRSEKLKHGNWAELQFDKVKSLVDISGKFCNQLKGVFLREPIDFNYIQERVEKAVLHFDRLLDELNYQVLKKRFELSNVKRMKEFQEDLENLDDVQIHIYFQLKRTKILTDTLLSGGELSKSLLFADNIENYRRKKYLRIQEEYKKESHLVDLLPHNFDEIVNKLEKTTKKKEVKKKGTKIPTHLVTLALLEEGKNVHEIAESRLMVESTIYGHLAKLVKEGKVEMSSILSREVISELSSQIKSEDKNRTLSEIRMSLKKDVDFNVLKIFLSSL